MNRPFEEKTGNTGWAPIARQAIEWTRDGRVAALIRHAHRDAIDGMLLDLALSTQLNQRGRREARALGGALAPARRLALVHSAVNRCQETAELMASGVEEAGAQASVHGVRALLTASFIKDPRAAVSLFSERGLRGVVVDWAQGRVGGPVVEDHRRTVAELIGLLLTPIAPGASSVLDLYVTHDFVVATLVAAAWPLQDDSVPWPGFLEGVLLRRENESVRLWYAGLEAELPLQALG